ncbi:hypothetical protein NPIL_141211, partial [Nephila pilipes]
PQLDPLVPVNSSTIQLRPLTFKNPLGPTRGEPSKPSCPGLPSTVPFHLNRWRPTFSSGTD